MNAERDILSVTIEESAILNTNPKFSKRKGAV